MSGTFGKSEEDLKKWRQELNDKEKSLTIEKHELERLKSSLVTKDECVRIENENLAKRDADICVREREIAQRELEAKNGFVREQRESFKDAIAIQLKDLDSRAKELDDRQQIIEKDFKELKILEGQLVAKERDLKERELIAENGFADKNRVYLREVEKREEDCKTFEELLKVREDEAAARHLALERRAEELRKREAAVIEAEQKLIEGFTEIRKQFDIELSNRRIKEFNLLEKRVSEEAVERRKHLDQQLSEERKRLDSLRETLNSKSAEISKCEDDLEYQVKRLESRKQGLDEREANLDQEVADKIIERKKSFESEKSALNDEIARLRESIKTSSALLSNFEGLKHKLGDEDPAAVLLRLKAYEEEIKSLREDLATRPTQEMQKAFDRLKYEKSALQKDCERLSEENNTLRSSARTQSDLEMQIAELTKQNKSLLRRFEAVDADNNRLMEELKRLQSSYEREQDREARIRDIETPYIKKELPRAVDKVEELQWLDGISKSCIDYGLRFPRRILHAFHTALKTSEWSPMTVLAGVSGTGKSELPRLYSHFGGINFLSLSVQPNWDSQESMLGFFNSIDNKFDAQPVLRLLAQTQMDPAQCGLKDVMSLILLDEMNLAHVELYFAEFLSKLELRRGSKGNEVPSLEVKLGAGIQHYDLPLGRNVLWVGTMNQDETTKSLSDKVLDRGIVINFPRPTTLERRQQWQPLGDQAHLLSRKLWERWWCREIKFNDDQILPFKGFIEEMNTSLSRVGRALGHRVWQSIEYYMANYPDVLNAQRNNDDAGLIKAMKIAFEDQLVQKVMPKLRGIETRGKSKSDCLDKIRIQLVNYDYTIIEDFDLACEFGYGQFSWNSANYLKDDEVVNGHKSSEN